MLMKTLIVAVIFAIVAAPESALAEPPAFMLNALAAPVLLRDTAMWEASSWVSAASLSAAQSQPARRSWPGRHPVLLGTLIGLGTGVGITAPCYATKTDPGGIPCSAFTGVSGVIGAGIGAGVGLAIVAFR